MDRLEDKEVTEAMNKCPICGGPLEAMKITHHQKYDDKVIILENVPALVCRQCEKSC
jgi:YgiT-type zinc finger domain-containing protein